MYVCMFAFVVLDLVCHCLAKRLAAKNISEMTYFVSGGTLMNQFVVCINHH